MPLTGRATRRPTLAGLTLDVTLATKGKKVFVQSVLPIIGYFIQAALLSALGTRPAAALIAAWKVHLYTAGPSPITPRTAISAFTEAAFTGYPAGGIAVTFAVGPVNLPSTLGIGLLQNAVFTCSAGGTPETILGYWIDDGTNLILAEAFATPIPVVNSGDFVNLTSIFPEPNEVQCE